MDFGLTDKIAFIAASSKGLGKAVAIELAKEGVHVIINGRSNVDLQLAKKDIEAITSKSVLAIKGDLSKKEDRNYIFKTVFNHFDHIDILVTNTGGPPAGNFESFEKEVWDETYELLLGSTIELIHAFLPGMKKQKWGRIIALTSVAVKQPVNNLILSNTIRSSIPGLIKSLANEYGSFQITFNSVMPGYTNTERLQNLLMSNPLLKNVVNDIPLARIGSPEEFAAAVVFLASERASYITGVALAVDGGAIKSI